MLTIAQFEKQFRYVSGPQRNPRKAETVIPKISQETLAEMMNPVAGQFFYEQVQKVGLR
jgi:hypothetical protein